MTEALLKNTFREIKNSKARFISIMAIIALGVGFFAGIKATVPSMYNLVRTYTDRQNLMDYRLVSTVGFDEDDIRAIRGIDGVTSVMPSYFCDIQTDADNGGKPMRLIALPTAYEDNSVQNELVVKEGRLPEKSGEIAADAYSFKSGGYEIGDKVRFVNEDNESTSDELDCLEFTVVGLVESPQYISYQRGTTTIGDGELSDYFYILPEDFAYERYTEVYVKTEISDKYSAYTDEYTEAIEKKNSRF